MNTVTLKTAQDLLTFDTKTGALVGLAPVREPNVNLLATRPEDPAFVLQYLDAGEYVTVDSRQAELTLPHDGEGIELVFRRVGGHDLTVTLNVSASPDKRFSRWSAWSGQGFPGLRADAAAGGGLLRSV